MKDGFVRELYLRATPSVDLDLLKEGEQVDCTKHTMPCSVYEELLQEFCENEVERFTANMYMLRSGPQLIEG